MKLKEKIDDWWYGLWRYTEPFSTLRDWYYNTRNFLFRRYDLIRTGLPKHQWCDKDGLILYGMMELLVDYVEKEKCFEVIDWDNDPHHQHAAKEIKTIYDWWKDYPNRQKAIEDQLSIWHEVKFGKRENYNELDGWLTKLNSKDSLRVQYEFEKHLKMEEKLLKEEQRMLHRLINIRKFLWT